MMSDGGFALLDQAAADDQRRLAATSPAIASLQAGRPTDRRLGNGIDTNPAADPAIEPAAELATRHLVGAEQKLKAHGWEHGCLAA